MAIKTTQELKDQAAALLFSFVGGMDEAETKLLLEDIIDTLSVVSSLTQNDIDVPLLVDASRNFAATDIGKVLYVTAPVTLTYPPGGLANFKTNIVCNAAGQATIAGTAAEILFPDGKIILAKKAVTLFKEPVNSKLTGYGEFSS